MFKQAVFVRPFNLALLAATAVCLVPAQAAERSGQVVVKEVCGSCHITGQDGAPKIGDVQAWIPHSKKGLARLTESAIAGIGKMPAHGGQPNLSDLEMSRAVAYMVSAGRALDPSKPYASPNSISGEDLVQQRCVACHEKGVDGAPRIDDFKAWKPRLQQGVESLIQSAIHGHKGMPARGGMDKLSDTDIRGAVTYLVVQSATYKPEK